MNRLKNIVSKVSKRMLLIDILKCFFVAIALSFTTYYLVGKSDISFAVSIIGLFLSGIFLKVWKNKKELSKNFIHEHNPQLEHSLSLIEKPKLNIAEEMQVDRILATKIQAPLKLDKAFWVLLILAILSSTFSLIPKKIKESTLSIKTILDLETNNSEPKQVKYKASTLQITPPQYTGLPKRVSENLNAEVITGSKLDWTVKFENAEDITVTIENAKGKSIVFKRNGSNYVHSDQILHSGFYSIKAFKKDSLIYQSDFYRIEALPDNPPKIEPTSKELYKFHQLKDPKNIQIQAKISDDFRVSQAFIVATVARGSGENVKFREVKWPVGNTNFHEANISKNIDLKALNFSPGDELYYYWAAFDNKTPEPNFTKSDTYFVVFKDTASKDESDLATMAMNILPEYFRSQRQIIIDTEKLIKKRNRIKQAVFNAESNEIGYDQKVLRLRYGQYLGEEFENSIGAAPHEAEDGDFMKGFVHAHDSEEQEDNHEHEEHGHEHEHAAENPNANQDPLAALMAEYVHSHDDAETNTFYEQSTRSLLKMALEQMWQAELHLRLYEPEKAIPFENKALSYLKEAQQKARVFVKKTGFDPPPIKEKEKRLTGELTKFNVKQTISKEFFEAETRLLAASIIDFLEKEKIGNSDKQKMLRLGQALAELPNVKSLILKDIQAIINTKMVTKQQKENLKTSLLAVLNFENQKNKGGRSNTNNKELETAFRKNLK
ncbi:hypothetical protein MCERE19_00232 [Spirosomataceae bacterium]